MSSLGIRSRLRWADNIAEAASAIAQRPVRTLLTALGTILGVGAFVTTTGLADTARAQVSARFDALKATEVRIQDANPDGTNPFPGNPDATLESLNGINHAGLIYAVSDSEAFQPRNSPSRLADNAQRIPLVAATPGAIAATLPTLTTGRLHDQFHERRAERVAVVGRLAADQLGISRTDNQPALFIGDSAYTVIGIVEHVARNSDLLLSVIIPASTERRYIATQDATYEVLIDTDPGAAQLAGRQGPIALRPQEPERLQALVPPDPQTLRNNVESDVTDLYYALAVLALFVGSIAIANATLLNTIERRPEIGLRRAIGARRSHITRQVILEAAITGAIAGTCGTALAILTITGTAHARGWTATINPTMTVVAPLIGLATGAVAGIVPALKAAQTPPATTLKG